MTPDFNAVSPIKAVARKAPLLLVHGKKDVRVDFQQSSDMASKMEGAGKVVQFLPLPKADHNFSREADRLELLKATEAFLRKYNPPD
jgi:dipeptidyl aminopeptidase/acylaminoacyl peptidase